MIRKNLKFLLILSLVLGLTSTGLAQGTQTGSIHGKVIDEEGNALPGATVTLSGPALMGTKTYVTGDRGAFRFPALLPGSDYEVKVEMPGFKTTIRKGLRVSVGKTTEFTITLEVAEIEEEVTVVAESPVVDVESTKVSIHYASDFISSIPINRDLYDIQNSIPGAISEERAYRRTSSILGGTVRSTLYALDGVTMNDPATFYAITNINIDVYEEVEFTVGAHPAEVGQTDSAYINIVTKSGGNQFSGGGTFYYTGESFAQDLLTSEEVNALGVFPPEKYVDYKDVSLNIGGPFIKDRLWFFLNGRRQTYEKVFSFTPEKRLAALGISVPHYDWEHAEWMGFGKLTFQLTKNLRYMGMFHYNTIYEPVYSNTTGPDISYQATRVWDEYNLATSHQFNWVLDQNTFLDLRGSYYHRYFPINVRPGQEDEYTYYDREQEVYWGRVWYDDEYVRKRLIASAKVTHFRDDLLGASHEFKAGFEFGQSEYHRDWFRGANPWYSYWRDYAAGNPYYYSTSGRRGRLRIRYCPGKKGEWDVVDNVRRFSGYIQDSAIAGRLALNLGVRLDYSYQ